MNRPVKNLAVAWLVASCALSLDAQQPGLFRARTELVAISASVKRGNAAVANLTAADFTLFDNDVAQKIDAVTIESVPLDVTLFMDTSGSTSGALDRMKRNVAGIAATLRPDDQFRLLTIGLSVESSVPWQPAGRRLTLTMRAVPGISLVYDALAVALAHEPAAGRRHLIVAMTDGEDCGSVVDGARVLDMGGRTDAVLHWVWVSNSGDVPPYSITAWCTPDDAREIDYVGRTVERTGGDTHRSRFGDPAVRTFARILDDFRQSYVLRYSPEGVAAGGWHRVRVAVPRHADYAVKSRAGYFGGDGGR